MSPTATKNSAPRIGPMPGKLVRIRASGRAKKRCPILQCSLHLDGVVARIEDEQGDAISFFEPTQQSLDLLGGDHVGVLGGPEALYVHGGGPALAHEVEPCNELVGPSCDDGLSGRVTGRMVVVVAALGTRLRVASGPHARVHGVDGRLPFGTGERMAGQELP